MPYGDAGRIGLAGRAGGKVIGSNAERVSAQQRVPLRERVITAFP
jgi:hypothetical protein